jgi:hypothetical protein
MERVESIGALLREIEMDYKARLDERTDKSGDCWVWTGPKNNKGYGHFRMGRDTRAHRVSYVLNVGPIPDGLFVLHRCDNPSCVRPDHLFLGTHQDNMDDRTRKGRNQSKLNAIEVAQIRDLVAARVMAQGQIARAYGVSDTTVSLIKHGHKWKLASAGFSGF